MEWFYSLLGHLADILTIYFKLGVLTVIVYFVAEWYILRYGDLDPALDEIFNPVMVKPPSNSTLDKIFRFTLNFLIG